MVCILVGTIVIPLICAKLLFSFGLLALFSGYAWTAILGFFCATLCAVMSCIGGVHLVREISDQIRSNRP